MAHLITAFQERVSKGSLTMVSVKTFGLLNAILLSLAAVPFCTCAIPPLTTTMTTTTRLGPRTSKGGSGENGGFYWHFWTDGVGDVDYENGPEGLYSVNWTHSNNFLGGKGWNPGTTDRRITYSADVFEPSGNGYLSVYGWTKDPPRLEYYVVEAYGTFDPTRLFSSNASRKVTIEADGGTYVMGRKRFVSLGGQVTDQLYSVRDAKDRRTAGTVNMKLHFSAWEQKLGVKFGTLDFQIVATEGYQSSGRSQIRVEKAD